MFRSVYRDRLPPNLPITVETLHSSHRITRKADEQYVPPGRLRHFDLLEYDEGSQYEDRVWTCIRTALAELSPGPFVVIFGDWQQLQPVGSGCLLKNALDKQVAAGAIKHIDIKAHEAARCQDPEMHQFLCHARCHQPKKGVVEDFFRGRFLPKDVNGAARASKEIEEAVAARRGSPCEFTLLPTTNQGAAALNQARVRLELGSDYDRLMATDAVPADPTMGGGSIVICEGLRMRLSRNVDKDRSFVNGMLGTVVKKLSNSVFVLKTSNGVLILVQSSCTQSKMATRCFSRAPTDTPSRFDDARAAPSTSDASFSTSEDPTGDTRTSVLPDSACGIASGTQATYAAPIGSLSGRIRAAVNRFTPAWTAVPTARMSRIKMQQKTASQCSHAIAKLLLVASLSAMTTRELLVRCLARILIMGGSKEEAITMRCSSCERHTNTGAAEATSCRPEGCHRAARPNI